MTRASTTRRDPTHELEEHVGEVALVVRAATLADVFAEGGRALAELMLDQGGLLLPAVGQVHRIEVHAPDRTALFVGWLNELVFLSETNATVFTKIAVKSASEHDVVAEASGVFEPVLKTAVKAATFHEARVEHDEDGFCARVVLDV